MLLLAGVLRQTVLAKEWDVVQSMPSVGELWRRLPGTLGNTNTNTNTNCIQDLQVYLNSFLGDKSIVNLFLYMGKGYNELGDYHGCQTHQGKYVILSIEIPTPIVTLALCIPLQCTAEDLSPVRSLLRDMINEKGGVRGKNLTNDQVKVHDVMAENRVSSHVRTGTIVGIVLPLSLLVLSLAVTAMERLAPSAKEPKSAVRSVLGCFDFVANLKSL